MARKSAHEQTENPVLVAQISRRQARLILFQNANVLLVRTLPALLPGSCLRELANLKPRTSRGSRSRPLSLLHPIRLVTRVMCGAGGSAVEESGVSEWGHVQGGVAGYATSQTTLSSRRLT